MGHIRFAGGSRGGREDVISELCQRDSIAAGRIPQGVLCVGKLKCSQCAEKMTFLFCLPDGVQVGSLGAERSAHGDGGTSAPKLPGGLGIDVFCEGEFN